MSKHSELFRTAPTKVHERQHIPVPLIANFPAQMSVENVNPIIYLPTSLSAVILCEWLDLKCAARLDSAFCNQTQRKFFLNLLQVDECVSSDPLVGNETGMLKWAVERGVQVSQLIVDWNYTFSLLHAYVPRHAKSIRTLTNFIERGTDQVEYEDVLYVDCRHLTELTCHLTLNAIKLIQNNPNLQKLSFLRGPSNAYTAALKTITLPHVASLSVVIKSWPVIESLLALLNATHDLKEFRMQGTNIDRSCESWKAIAKHCPNLRVFASFETSIFDTQIADFTRLCPHITSFTMTENGLFGNAGPLATDSDNAVTDEGVLSIVRNLTQLRVLNLCDCNHLTDTSLSHIATYCSTTLQELYLGNTVVTQEAVAQLLNACVGLKRFGWHQKYARDEDGCSLGCSLSYGDEPAGANW